MIPLKFEVLSEVRVSDLVFSNIFMNDLRGENCLSNLQVTKIE